MSKHSWAAPVAAVAVVWSLAGAANAAELTVTIEIPRLSVAEYHRPYVAVWIESKDRDVTNLAVWYDVNLADDEGTTWLKDLRQWWRRAGRSAALPIDGVTAATRPPGQHALQLSAKDARLHALKPGDYELVVEAAREVGGRELVRVPFAWPPERAQQLEATGTSELGRVQLVVDP